MRVTSRLFEHDPYSLFRDAGHIVTRRGEQVFPLIVNYDDVRQAAKDWQTFTSDTPFEVPIPHERNVRNVRQLPIESDPPEHALFRAMAGGTFGRDAIEAHAAFVGDVVEQLLVRALDRGTIDVVPDLALPTVNSALAAALGRPVEDAELWLSWGIHVFHPRGHGPKEVNAELDGYLEGVVDEARRGGDAGFFGQLADARFGTRSLTREEMLGFANLMFAGGRDTVVSAIATAFVVLADLPDALGWIRSDPANARSAVDEILRIRTPLPYIGRHATIGTRAGGCPVARGDLVALGFAAANRDPSAFENPDDCDLSRRPNRHIAFGYGPHTCLGAHLARMEVRVTLERTAALVDRIELSEPPELRYVDIAGHRVVTGFERVVADIERSQALHRNPRISTESHERGEQ